MVYCYMQSFPHCSGGALPYQTGFISNITFQFTLPPDVYACDLAVFTVWCQLAGVQFAVLDIPSGIFVSFSLRIGDSEASCHTEDHCCI